MQVASDLLGTALEGLVQALVLIGVLAGALVLQSKRKTTDPRDQLIKQLNSDLAKAAEAIHELGERISFLEGKFNGR